MVASDVISKPVRAFGGFFSMALDTFVALFQPPFAWREFIAQSWFVARVSILPTLLLTIPYTVLLTFITTILLTEIGAADFSGTGAALARCARSGRSSPFWWSPVPAPPRCAPTWAPARSVRNSTRCG